MTSQTASVYLLKTGVLVHPMAKTISGLWIAAQPYVLLPLSVDAAALGKSIADALSHSASDVPDPTDWTSLAAPRLRAAGVGSERAFQTHAKLVEVSLTSSEYSIQAHTNGGTAGDSKGFHPSSSHQVSRDADHSTLGHAVFASLALC